jgi:hypothetical protein
VVSTAPKMVAENERYNYSYQNVNILKRSQIGSFN